MSLSCRIPLGRCVRLSSYGTKRSCVRLPCCERRERNSARVSKGRDVRSFASERSDQGQDFRDALGGKRYALLDVPVSNHGARVRFLLYEKGVEDDFVLLSPTKVGGLRSDTYLRLNPIGKMPVLIDDGTGLTVFESDAIVRYIDEVYEGRSKKMVPEDPRRRAIMNMIVSVHDHYVSNVQGCMYRDYGEDRAMRAKHLEELNRNIDVLEKLMVSGPYAVGEEISLADATLFPTFVFFTYILPSKFGWKDVFRDRPHLAKWWKTLRSQPAGAKVYEEVHEALKKWDDDGRWDKVGVTQHVKDTNHRWSY